jgi:hypothetical protein
MLTGPPPKFRTRDILRPRFLGYSQHAKFRDDSPSKCRHNSGPGDGRLSAHQRNNEDPATLATRTRRRLGDGTVPHTNRPSAQP